MTWSVFAPPTPIPVVVVKGSVKRIFRFVDKVIKKSDAYTETIGAESSPVEEETTTPDFWLALTTGDVEFGQWSDWRSFTLAGM